MTIVAQGVFLFLFSLLGITLGAFSVFLLAKAKNLEMEAITRRRVEFDLILRRAVAYGVTRVREDHLHETCLVKCVVDFAKEELNLPPTVLERVCVSAIGLFRQEIP